MFEGGLRINISFPECGYFIQKGKKSEFTIKIGIRTNMLGKHIKFYVTCVILTSTNQFIHSIRGEK